MVKWLFTIQKWTYLQIQGLWSTWKNISTANNEGSLEFHASYSIVKTFFVTQCKKYGYEFNGQLDFWDLRYYSTLIEETKYSVDQARTL